MWLATAPLVGALAAAGFRSAAADPANTSVSREISTPLGTTGASIAVTVPAGSLAISTAGNTLVLARRPGNGSTTRYEGVLPRVQVTDTRAPRIGWLAQVSFASPSSIDPSSSRLFFHPGQPSALYGNDRGVRKGQPEWTTFGSQVSLFSAEQGAGGGTHSDDATVVLVVPRSNAPSITLMFDASVY